MLTRIMAFLKMHKWVAYTLIGALTIYVVGFWSYYCLGEGCTHPVDWAFHMKEEASAAWALVVGTLFGLFVTERSASDRDRREEKRKEEEEHRRQMKERAATIRYVIMNLATADWWKTVAANNFSAFRQVTWQDDHGDMNAIGLLRHFTTFGENDYAGLTPPDGIDADLAYAAFMVQLRARQFLWVYQRGIIQAGPYHDGAPPTHRILLRGARGNLAPLTAAAEALASAASTYARKIETYEQELAGTDQKIFS